MNTIWIATAIAISGSRIDHSGLHITTSRPATMPTVVHTSVIRCLASASSVMLSCALAARSMIFAVAKFMPAATTDTRIPQPRLSTGAGCSSRCTAAQAIDAAATRISAPSTPLAKYSALSWPKW